MTLGIAEVFSNEKKIVKVSTIETCSLALLY